MTNLKFDFSRYICAADQSLVRTLPLSGVSLPCGLTYVSKPNRGDIRAPERVADHPASLYHSNISLEMIILPFFHDSFSLSLYFFNNWRLQPRYYDYFDKLLLLENVVIFKTRQDSGHYNLDIVSKTVYKYCINYCLEC